MASGALINVPRGQCRASQSSPRGRLADAFALDAAGAAGGPFAAAALPAEALLDAAFLAGDFLAAGFALAGRFALC